MDAFKLHIQQFVHRKQKNKAPNLIFIPIPETTIEENIYTGNISLKYGYYYYLLLNLFFL